MLLEKEGEKILKRNPHVPKRSKKPKNLWLPKKIFFSGFFFSVWFCQNHPFHGHLLWTNNCFPREECLHFIHITISAFSSLKDVWVQCSLKGGEGFSLLCLPCWVFSFFQQPAQLRVKARILACMDSWLIWWLSFVQMFLKAEVYLGRLP